MRSAKTLLLILAGLCLGNRLPSSEMVSPVTYERLSAILSVKGSERLAAAEAVRLTEDPSWVPALVDAVFFTPKTARSEILGVLESLTGESFNDYYDWVAYVGANPELEPPPGYPEWKVSLLQRIDPQYQTVFYSGAPARIRLEEVVWGGVPMAGIPALDDPPTIPGNSAKYLKNKELVFGLWHRNESRAYPLRILSWHELLNDHLGGDPIALSFCTLCGSGIFFATHTPDGGSHRFDTSGLLYRSNKLMVDRKTRSLWSNLTGEPVVGRLAGSSIRLEMLPGTVTTWESWLSQNPSTSVLDLEAIREQMRPRFDYDYRPGAAERFRRGVSFPVWQQSDELERDTQVFVLRIDEGIRAYPVDQVVEVGLINDQIGAASVLIVGDRVSGSIRAYRRGSLEFSDAGDGLLQDGESGRWRIEEEGLRAVNSAQSREDLQRLPGHLALWFGWYGFFPETEVWRK